MGDDPLKKFVLDDLKKSGIECDPIIDKTRPTTQKCFYICNDYRLLKVDRVDNHPITDKMIASFSAELQKSKDYGAVVFSDYRHGIFSKTTVSRLTSAIPKGPLKVADSQVASRWGNILDFKGFDLITPNEKEARFALGDQDTVVRPMALQLYNQAQCKYLTLKMGEKGMLAYRPGVEGDPRRFFTIDAFAEKVADAVGSGDALLSYATLALVATQSICIASILGSIAAALACETDGNLPIGPNEVRRRIEELEKRCTTDENRNRGLRHSRKETSGRSRLRRRCHDRSC